MRRKQEAIERKQRREKRRQEKLAAEPRIVEITADASLADAAATPGPAKIPSGPIAFVFPGQGSQAIGMLKVPFLSEIEFTKEHHWLKVFEGRVQHNVC